MNVRGKKVFVGLSGGVDSAVSALLLQQAGASVTGVFIKGWYPPDLPCTWALDRRDALRVAAHLRIPFVTLDASAEYKKSVIDYLLSEYRVGRTPNPDIMCNRDIKFGVFYRFAKEHGADHIATGHYRSGEKDQTYFMWAVPKEILRETVFPVGHLDKKEVRRLAEKCALPVAHKKDSQGICFLGSISVEEFLMHQLGTDNQALLHTIGQRVSKEGGPWYVTDKDVARGDVTLSKTWAVTHQNQIRFSHPNWHIPKEEASEGQYRYRGPRVRGHLKDSVFLLDAPLDEPIAPGQSIVFYRGVDCVGGGIIET
jgi:tRNA-uridine 2-sulfurtransferase